MFEKAKLRFQATRQRADQDKIREAGDTMAATILDQIEHGQNSPYTAEATNSIKYLSDEMFLLRSTTRAVERLATICIGEELPVYNEASTLIANQETKQKELIVIFTRPSEA